ncbi:MAG: hypothetical protein O2854_09515, partial [Chloroflexi bacterium]|nr:hypothetical protein [Chloroflexota bacterium]
PYFVPGLDLPHFRIILGLENAVGGVVLFVCWPFADLDGMSSLGEGVAVLLACYVLGHALRATISEHIKSTKPSRELLSPRTETSDASKIFSAPQKERIIRVLNSSFSLDLPAQPNGDQQQEAFRLAYTAIVQNDVAGYVPLYNSLYALYRGLLAASMLSSAILAVSLISWAYRIGRGVPLTAHAYATAVFFLLFTYLAWGGPRLKSPLLVQFNSYAQSFAKSVYVNFLVWRQTKGLLG